MQTLQQNCKSPNRDPSIDEEVTLKIDSHQNSFGKSLLSPFLVNTLESPDFVFASYCPRHNMILGCFFNNTIKFYDASTLLPLEGRKTVQLDGYVTCMFYDDETDTFLIGCGSGSIHTYNASSEELKKLRKYDYVQVATFLGSRFYALGYSKSRGLALGSLDNDDFSIVSLGSTRNSDCMTLKELPHKNLLLSSFENGFVRVYRTDKLPYLQNLCSLKACPTTGEWIAATEVINVNGKELIVTSGRNCTMKIWRLIKGKLKLLKIIHTLGRIHQLVYLENYKMIAALYDRSNKIGFWKLFSGKLERTLVCSKSEEIWSLMKDKNVIGGILGAEISSHSIGFFQLHPEGQ